MILSFACGRGERIWFAMRAGRLALALGMPDMIRMWAAMQADRVNGRGRLEVSHTHAAWFVGVGWWTEAPV